MKLHSGIAESERSNQATGRLEGNRPSNCGMVRDLSPGDALSVAAMQLSTFPEMRGSLLGINFLEEFYHRHIALADAINLGIELHGKMAGFACGGPNGYEKPLLSSVKGTATWAVLRRPWVIYRLWLTSLKRRRLSVSVPPIEGEPSPRALESLIPPIFLLRIIAVDEIARNVGCGRRLLTEFEKHARRRGARSIVLTVLRSNLSARRLYLSQGMSPVASPEHSSIMRYGQLLDD